MRIAFITGRLERGRDGVGDYTRMLAGECAHLGHEVALLSIAERSGDAFSATESFPTLRLDRAGWRNDDGVAAKRWLAEFRPDWTSLQFVPYSFDPRGLFGADVPALIRLLEMAPRRHIFFHETWIGSHAGAPLKARAIGWLQRCGVARLLRGAAAQVHTSNCYYQAALRTLGCGAGLLPMFGSVPVPRDPQRPAEIAGVPRGALVCGGFGSLHPNWEVDGFFTELIRFAADRSRAPVFVTSGEIGYGATRFQEIAARWRGRVTCVATGRSDEENLARLFARFDFAATSVPWIILGKSSSAAALREHGLQVVVTAAGSPPRFPELVGDESPAGDDGFVPFFRTHSLPENLLERRRRQGARRTAEAFLEALHAHG